MLLLKVVRSKAKGLQSIVLVRSIGSPVHRARGRVLPNMFQKACRRVAYWFLAFALQNQ